MICDSWDVVVVPFPFVERSGAKRRPALVLSRHGFNEKGHTIMAMVTTHAHEPWMGDTIVTELGAAGLRVPCIVRLKLFTLDNRLILRKLGALAEPDRESVSGELTGCLRGQ